MPNLVNWAQLAAKTLVFRIERNNTSATNRKITRLDQLSLQETTNRASRSASIATRNLAKVVAQAQVQVPTRIFKESRLIRPNSKAKRLRGSELITVCCQLWYRAQHGVPKPCTVWTTFLTSTRTFIASARTTITLATSTTLSSRNASCRRTSRHRYFLQRSALLWRITDAPR